MAKSQSLSQLLAAYSWILNISVASLLLAIGTYLIVYGIGNIDTLVKLVSVTLIIAGIRRILDTVRQTLMGKELERLEKMLKEKEK